jgi:hypothetical protein
MKSNVVVSDLIKCHVPVSPVHLSVHLYEYISPHHSHPPHRPDRGREEREEGVGVKQSRSCQLHADPLSPDVQNFGQMSQLGPINELARKKWPKLF